jgi:hypothetical protein
MVGSVQYFPTEADALANTNMITSSGYYTVESHGGFTSWRIASTSTGTSSQAAVYHVGDSLVSDGFYRLYPGLACFLEGTRILCLIGGKEKYLPIEEIWKGDMVKTSRDGYKKVEIIARGVIDNIGTDERIEDRLYKCSPAAYPELIKDLYITGCHSILVDNLTEVEREDTIKRLGKLFVTDHKYRLMACVDKRAEPWKSEGVYNIWHLALENADPRMNYGIFAEGLLVETCSISFLQNKSNMTQL